MTDENLGAAGQQPGVSQYEKQLSDPEGERVDVFLRRVLSELEEVLEANVASTAFDGCARVGVCRPMFVCMCACAPMCLLHLLL